MPPTIPQARALRFATFLAPALYSTYEYIVSSVGKKTGHPATLTVGQSVEEFAGGQVDAGFLCGLVYVRTAESLSCPFELVAAPVLQGKRYEGKPIYYSDVIVRRASSYTSFDGLEGCVWAYNEVASHSGWILVCSSLLKRGKPAPYFSRTIETGSHQRSLQMVLEGRVDATAIDSHLLDILLLQNAKLANQLRIIATLGPSTIPPVVVAKRLDSTIKRQIQGALLTMHHDRFAASRLGEGSIEKFVPITDEHYQDIREMAARVQEHAALFARL